MAREHVGLDRRSGSLTLAHGPGFLGCEPELERARAALGQHAALRVEGLAGVGKTAFLERLAEHAAARGTLRPVWIRGGGGGADAAEVERALDGPPRWSSSMTRSSAPASSPPSAAARRPSTASPRLIRAGSRAIVSSRRRTQRDVPLMRSSFPSAAHA
jgi:hypothetical protein